MTHSTNSQETKMFRTGEIVDGRYRVIEEVGHGGYGTVFLAEELHPPHLFESNADAQSEQVLRRVAVKVFTRMNAEQTRFKREIEAMCRLEHPNIVPVFSFGRDRRSEERRVGKEVEGLGEGRCVTRRTDENTQQRHECRVT